MTISKYLSHLRKGIKHWNDWRESNPEIKPNFQGVNLSRLDLRGGNFSNVNFQNANLRRTNLTGADLSGANLRGVDLAYSVLTESVLREADLSETRTLGAIFKRADLTGAILDISAFDDPSVHLGKDEHVEILRKGAKYWNEWREKDPDIQPNLKELRVLGLNLSGLNLSNTDLRGADMSGATIIGSTLTRAKLNNAELVGVDIRDSDFSGADLTSADLSSSNVFNSFFKGTCLENVDLSLANIRNTTFEKGHFREVIFAETLVSNCILKGLLNLEECVHLMPSIIDQRTLMHSRELPVQFLRGVGLPNTIIEYYLSTTNGPTEFYSCFISYSSIDEDFVKKIYSDLQDNGVRCWFAREDMRGGKKLRHQINEAIQSHDKLLLILSEESMRSEWVIHEIKEARKREEDSGHQMLFPVRIVSFNYLKDWEIFDTITGKNIADEVRAYFIPDFSEWKYDTAYDESLKTLLKSLNSEIHDT